MSTVPTSAVASALALPTQFHNLSVSVPEGVCEDYLAGFCPNGDDCTLRHEEIDLQSMPPANPPSQQHTQIEESVCPDFEAGFCPNGDRCPRSHADSVPEGARDANEEGDENLPFSSQRDGQRSEANAENVPNVVTPNTAPRICADYQSGFCPNGEDCPEPHDESELLVQLSAVRSAPVRSAPATPTTAAPTKVKPAQASASATSPVRSLSTAPDVNHVSDQGLKEKEKETARKEETARREIADTAQKQVEPLVIPDEEIDVDALPDEPDEEVDMDAVPQMLNKPYAESDDVEETPRHVEKDAEDESLGREDDFTHKSPGKRGSENMEVDFGTRATAKRPRPDYSDLSYAQSEGNVSSVNGKHINPPSFRRDSALDEFISVPDGKEPLETLAVPSPSPSPSPPPPPPPPASPPAAPPDYPPPGKVFYCEICKKDCNSQSNYQSHIRGKKHAIKEKQMKLRMRNSALRDHFLPGVAEADEIARIRTGRDEDRYRAANGNLSQGSTLASSSLPQSSVVSAPRSLPSTSTETAQTSNAQPNITANTTENAKTTTDKKPPEKRLIEKQSTDMQPVKMQPAKSQAHPVQSAENLEVARNDLKDTRSSPTEIIENVARDSAASVSSGHSAGHSPSLAGEKVASKQVRGGTADALSSTSNLAKTSANETVGVKQVHSRGETLRAERKPSASEKGAAESTREARQRQAEESSIIPRTGTIDQAKPRTHRDPPQLAKPNIGVNDAKIHTPPSRRVGSLESIAPPAGQVEAGKLAGPTKVAEAGEHSTAKEFSQVGESGDNAKRLGSGKTSNLREGQVAEESERRKEKESRKDTERGEHPKPGKQSRVPSIEPVSSTEAAQPSMRENSRERNLRPSERSGSRGTESSPEPMDIVLDRRHVQDKGSSGRSRMIASGNSRDVNDDTSSRHRSSNSRNAYSAQDPRKDYAYPNHGRSRQNSRPLPSEESAAATVGARPLVPRFTSRPLGPDGRMDQSVRKNDARQSASSAKNDGMAQMNRAQHPSERPTAGLNPSLPRVSQDVLDKQMTIAHWKALREKSRNGSALDQLTFKILQEFLLSPSVGVGSQHLKPFSKILRHVPHYRDPEKGVIANFWSVPSALTTIEPPEGEGQQVEYSQEEISAAQTFADNLLYQFYRKSSEEEDTHRRVDEELPSRGHFPKGNEGISEPNVKGNEDVTSDALFREMEQRSVSHIRNGSQGHR